MKGWHRDGWQHGLAARGIKTSARSYQGAKYFYKRSKAGLYGKVGETSIIVEQHKPGKVYPVTPEDAKKALERVSEHDRKGLKAIEFVEPRKGEQEGAYAQYVRSKKKILVFAQPEGEVLDGGERYRKHMKEYVLPHEIGHHTALEVHHITDEDIAVAEARADGAAAGMSVDDRDIKQFVHLHKL